MSTLHDIVRLTHIFFGTIALTAFWTTAAMRKGTPVHRRTGGAYLLAMAVVLATSPMLAAFAYARGQWVFGSFLLYLVLITGTTMWLARHAIRMRRNVAEHYGASYRAVAVANLVGGAATCALGLYAKAPVLAGMSLIGLGVGAQMLYGARRRGSEPGWWVRRHVAAICGCGIATHIAFVNVGLSHAVPADYAQVVQLLGWFGPVIVGFTASRLLERKYGGGRLAAAAG
jgi:hypothetical protein